ncbi:hypothetical protein KKB44_06715, partial [Candidatus Micrarchaeota archaeon]|nr:hypothetical protein [Candidatus Micrarchaeota archaeon]
NGTAWSLSGSLTNGTVEAVYAADATHVWAVAWGGVINFFNGAVWSTQASGTTEDFYDVHGTGPADVWAVTRAFSAGRSPRIQHYNGTVWSNSFTGSANAQFRGVCAAAPDDVWVVGSKDYGSSNVRPAIWHYDGSVWTDVTLNITIPAGVYEFQEVYALDSSHTWISGGQGCLIFYDGSSWSFVNTGISTGLGAIHGFDADDVWVCDGSQTVLWSKTAMTPASFTELYLGQRDTYSAQFDPVKEIATGTLVNTTAQCLRRRSNNYRTVNTGTTVEAEFILPGHGDRFMLVGGFTFGASTAYDTITVTMFLRATDGTVITSATKTFTIDLANPNTLFKELLTFTDRQDPFEIPTAYTRWELAAALNQVIRISLDPSLATTFRHDYFGLIPVDKYVEVTDFSGNALVLAGREDRAILKSIDGTLELSEVFDPTKTLGTPKFKADPAGINLTLVAVNDSAGDHQVALPLNVIIKYRPRYFNTA